MNSSKKEQINFIINALANLAIRNHYQCEDNWYSCPKSEDGCSNDNYNKTECNCGADEINIAIENLRQLLLDCINKESKEV